MSASNITSKQFALVLLQLLIVGMLFGQHVPTDERGDYNYRRQTDIDGNKVRTTIFNYGLTGRTGAVAGEIPYEWPINSGQHYIALTALFVGSEVVVADGDSTAIKPFVTVPLGRTDDFSNSMTFEPVPAYMNPSSNRIAKSDEPETWPEIWPDKMGDENDPGWRGSWNGFFGKDQFNADQEMYFKISDDNNFLRAFTYYPDTTDLDRRGAGILAGIRVMEWSQVLVEDVVFILYEIKNDGTKDLDKVSFALWLADLVGGDGDSGDDAPGFDLLYDIAWSKDKDGRGNAAFGNDPVGVAATSYLETPGNSVDRIDNDADGETGSKKITYEMLQGENIKNARDDNGNGLIDENHAHMDTIGRAGVGYADMLDDNHNGEAGSPVVTPEMVAAVIGDKWHRWPPNPASDTMQQGQIHIIMLADEDLGHAFADNIDNNESEEYPYGLGADLNAPRITQAIIDTAATDSYRRYRVPGTGIILYDVEESDLGMRYADGIDNDGDGAVDEGIDEGIDEMIDESRDDFIDNDGDWNPISDDLGYDGNINSLDEGQNDMRPTSGALSNFPGEPNIDKTDVSESDQMGLTSVAYDEAGGIPTTSDRALWISYMLPGNFNVPDMANLTGDFDLFVTSAFFPINAGETKRISMAVSLGTDTSDAIHNKDVAQRTYDEDYQFAKQPVPPHVKAISGDQKVTLIWDDVAEQSYDSYMYGIGSPAYDFEGYKIYKATDPGFADALNITDAQGNLTYSTPIATWDLDDGITGYHEVAVNGVQYHLGFDTGLMHSFVDTDVKNGQKYYYAVVSYDFGGDISNQIPPTESNKRLVINTLTGDVRKGTNVAIVTPNPPAAGFVEADLATLDLIEGTTSSFITYEIVDHFAVPDNHTYHVSFEDTIYQGIRSSVPDTLTTKHFHLVDVTDPANPDTLIKGSDKLTPEFEQPIIDGIQFTFYNESFVMMNPATSRWASSRVPSDSLWRFGLTVYKDVSQQGLRVPADYRLIIGDIGIATSTEFTRDFGSVVPLRVLPAKDVNFKVVKRIHVTGDDAIDWAEIPFAFEETVGDDGMLDASDRENDLVIFLDNDSEAEGDTSGAGPKPSWVFQVAYPKSTSDALVYQYQPAAGDTAKIFIIKPFLSSDKFELTTKSSKIDKELAQKELDGITVVPNPYKVAVAWEPRNPYTTGRGPRELHFRHLPSECTIRIYNVAGELVKKIDHVNDISNGTAIWDLLSKDNLDVSYGIYIYHVEAPGIGEKIGKFAIIK
ncbi:hypothetical protein ACFL6E_00585 [Candidatus Neomarinimicrobiota bacterium]